MNGHRSVPQFKYEQKQRGNRNVKRILFHFHNTDKYIYSVVSVF